MLLRRRSAQSFNGNPMKVYIFWNLKSGKIRQNVNLKWGTKYSRDMMTFLEKITESSKWDRIHTDFMESWWDHPVPFAKGLIWRMCPIFWFFVSFQSYWSICRFDAQFWALPNLTRHNNVSGAFIENRLESCKVSNINVIHTAWAMPQVMLTTMLTIVTASPVIAITMILTL